MANSSCPHIPFACFGIVGYAWERDLAHRLSIINRIADHHAVAAATH